MRGHVLRLLQDAGIDCVVRDVQVDELASADEVFLTNSQFGILPLRQCADLQWSVGAITQQAQELAAGNGVPECAV
jgi:4-amino-4-deoxychorismate lyase